MIFEQIFQKNLRAYRVIYSKIFLKNLLIKGNFYGQMEFRRKSNKSLLGRNHETPQTL